MTESPVSFPFIRGDDLARFYSKLVKDPGGCWLWRHRCVGGGYGQFYDKGKYVGAHRWSHRQFIGPIPEGYEVDHLCRVPNCVNPEHLEAVTRAENQRRRRLAACRRGHDLNDPDNIYVHEKRRHCRPCRTENQRERRAAYEKGRAPEPRVTECRRGHDMTDPENVYLTGGERGCRQCRTENGTRYREINRDKINARRREIRAEKRRAALWSWMETV